MNFPSAKATLVAFIFAMTVSPASAEDSILVRGNQVEVSESDIWAEIHKMSAEQKKKILADYASVKKIATSIYVRRSMAKVAIEGRLAEDSVSQAALKLSHDRILADLLLAKIDQTNTPNEMELERLALSKYNSDTTPYQHGEEINTRHILIKTGSTDAQNRANELLKQIKAGADFEALAQEKSEDKGSAKKGGEIGYVNRKKMVAEYEKAAWALEKPGELSEVVQTQFGYHIIKLIDKRPAGTRSYEEVKEKIKVDVLTSILNLHRQAEAEKYTSAAIFDEQRIQIFSERPKEIDNKSNNR